VDHRPPRSLRYVHSKLAQADVTDQHNYNINEIDTF